VLLVVGIAVAACLTWVLPAGEFSRRDDPATGRRVVVAGTYRTVESSPVGAFATAVSVPRGFVEGADVVATILFVGAAFFVLDRVGTLGRLVGALVRRFADRRIWAIPVVALFFGLMGALENMQEEIVALVPVLLVLGRGLRVSRVAVVAMSSGAAIIGSAFSPTNPFQAGIAMKLAELPPLSGAGLRIGMLVVGLAVWTWWVMRDAHASHEEYAGPASDPLFHDASSGTAPLAKDALLLSLAVLPILFYIYGAVLLGWDFNSLSGAFVVAGIAIGLVGGLGVTGTTTSLLEGAQAMLPAALLVGLARSISVVLSDGRVIDTILHGLATPLGEVPATASALLMIPFHALLHVPVPSVSGQAALTMPILVPLSDLLGISRQVTVLAYQAGAGLTEMLTPTNGALMAVLLAAGVPFSRWLRFAVGAYLVSMVVALAGIAVAVMLGI
jgi:uncharacterized ion transporter superfamily protein YfcC